MGSRGRRGRLVSGSRLRRSCGSGRGRGNGSRRLGRSFGCPVVRPEIADSLIHTIRDGTLLYASYPDSNYATHSVYMTP